MNHPLNERTVAELNHCDDASRKLVRGALLKKSEDCKNNRHKQRCSSSHCNCKCHRVAQEAK